MTIKATWTIAALLGLAASISAQVIDTSETRVQTTLDPGLKRIGTLKPRAVGEIAGQNWAIGCETLDRAFASYDSYKDYLVPLGIKKIRLQGGWANTEREKGKLKKESLFTWFIYHGYTRNPDQGHYENVEKLKVLFESKQSGQTLLVFWDKSNVPSNTNSTVAATFTLAKGAFTETVWVDLITGGIHAIPSEKFVAEGEKVTFKNIPVYDAPALITEKSLVHAPTKTKGL